MRTHRSLNRTPDCHRPREGLNKCVLCEMERHNGRLVALTMRFHTKRGWRGEKVAREQVWLQCKENKGCTRSISTHQSQSLSHTHVSDFKKLFHLLWAWCHFRPGKSGVLGYQFHSYCLFFVVTAFCGFIMYSRQDKNLVLFRICNEASKGCYYKNCRDK